eukprot:gene28868-6489_t
MPEWDWEMFVRVSRRRVLTLSSGAQGSAVMNAVHSHRGGVSGWGQLYCSVNCCANCLRRRRCGVAGTARAGRPSAVGCAISRTVGERVAV